MAKKKQAITKTDKTDTSAADAILDQAKGKFPVVLVIGVNDKDMLDFSTNVPQYQYLQWLVNKASFELFVHERNSVDAKNSEAVANLVEKITA